MSHRNARCHREEGGNHHETYSLDDDHHNGAIDPRLVDDGNGDIDDLFLPPSRKRGKREEG